MKVTQWFFVGDNPARPGLYEVRYSSGMGLYSQSTLVYFDGRKWDANDSGRIPWSAYHDQWRGLAEQAVKQD